MAMIDKNRFWRIGPINGVNFERMAQYDSSDVIFSCDCRKMGINFYIKIDATEIALAKGPELADMLIFDALKHHAFQHNDLVKKIEQNVVTVKHKLRPNYVIEGEDIEFTEIQYDIPTEQLKRPRRMLRPNLIKHEESEQ